MEAGQIGCWKPWSATALEAAPSFEPSRRQLAKVVFQARASTVPACRSRTAPHSPPTSTPASISAVERAKTRSPSSSCRHLGITPDTWRAAGEDGVLTGHVCCVDDKLVGYCFANCTTGEIVVLALQNLQMTFAI